MSLHYHDPNPRLGNSRNGGDASQSVKDSVKAEIVKQAQDAGLTTKDIQNLLAIAEHESGFNPDAANKISSASGVFQITDKTAKDAHERLNDTQLIDKYHIALTYDKFDPASNIQTGIAVYLDKKRLSGGSDDIEKIYKGFYPKATDKELSDLLKRSEDFLNYILHGTFVGNDVSGSITISGVGSLIGGIGSACGIGTGGFTAAMAGLVMLPRSDPLVLDLDGDGIETTNARDGSVVLFDQDGDGIKIGMGWVKSDDGFLVLDRDGNGRIDSGRELFGDATLKSNGQLAKDGFDALKDLDANQDGKITALDSIFTNLRIWRDLNQDGISQASELTTLAANNIVYFCV